MFRFTTALCRHSPNAIKFTSATMHAWTRQSPWKYCLCKTTNVACVTQLAIDCILCFFMASHNAGQSVRKYRDFLLANTLSKQTYSTITAAWFCILQPSLLTDLYWLKVCSGISWFCETCALCSVYSEFSRCAASTYMSEHHNRHQHTVEASRAYKSLFYSKYVYKNQPAIEFSTA